MVLHIACIVHGAVQQATFQESDCQWPCFGKVKLNFIIAAHLHSFRGKLFLTQIAFWIDAMASLTVMAKK